ncbi:NADPH-dependent F420 reductase [Solitalea lacus]|uniref:NADPH-dependent F420 reductase n=1 Tax=Solitalea lacus TaxID=2911172 RepID=UPI001EDC551B|nr:NAD(P)-binding domain-containing protein [Solitalea lacus]UKJ06729.1 NAD(P)-binding domain-containing protein [Solitalea lacus]
MKIAVLGTGMVGVTIASKLIELGHEVKLGSRSATNEKAEAWMGKNGRNASQGTFADAAKFGEVVFNCTKGVACLEVLKLAGAENLKGKILIDVSNPLDDSKGMPPSLAVSNTDSLGEQIQRAFPDVKVVKTLNTMWCGIMVNPRMLPETTNVYLSGNDADAKATVKGILKSFGWQEEEMLDLGDITTARGSESVLPIWLRVWMATGNGAFNFKIVAAQQ